MKKINAAFHAAFHEKTCKNISLPNTLTATTFRDRHRPKADPRRN